MPLQKIVLRPGINREGTNYSNEGGYWACDKVRFRSGYPEKIGGWTLYSASEFWGVARSMLPFQCQCGATLTGLGTNLKFYVEFGAAFYDITPLAETNTLGANPFTGDGTTTVAVTDAGRTVGTGDFVTFSGVTGAYAGVLNGEFKVTYISGSTYSITTSSAVAAGATGGSAVSAAYQVSVGGSIYTQGTGWGAGNWARGAWGSATSVGVGLQLRLWSLDNYGDALIFGPRGGGLYYWDYNAGAGLSTRGELVADMPGANSVPIYQNEILVSDQSRFVITLGSNDFGSTDANPMLVRWSDQENYLEWEPTALTQAGSQILSIGSQLITARQTRQEIVIWSDAAVFAMQYAGPPYVFGFTTLADNTTIAGPNAAIVVNNVAYWMGTDKFYSYNGKVDVLPSTLRSYVFNDFNTAQAWQVTTGAVSQYNEVWWFYCSANSNNIDRYVVFNYVDNIWFSGSMNRFAWVDSGLKQYPIASVYDEATEKGQIYAQEYGFDDFTTSPATPIAAYIDSSDFDIGEGDNFGLVNRIIPDISFEGSTGTSPTVNMTLYPRRFPGADYSAGDETSVVRSHTVPVEQYTEQVFVRVRGRQMRFRVASSGLGVMWQLGMPRIQMRPDGRK